MTEFQEDARILLVDDGELDPVADVLDDAGLPYRRLRGGQIPAEVAPPEELLVVTPRRLERVRRGSPSGARTGRPLRIVAVAEDSPAMRRRLRRQGLDLLVRIPVEREIWRLLIARALYRGEERREEPRVAVGSPVSLDAADPVAPPSAVLLDLSNRGCRLRTAEPLGVGDIVVFTLPSTEIPDGAPSEPLQLRGEVRRLSVDGQERSLAVSFDESLSEEVRTGLAAVINRWASGPSAAAVPSDAQLPSVPAARLAALPDLVLDDETDPPVVGAQRLSVALEPSEDDPEARASEADRRRESRGHYASTVMAIGEEGARVFLGRDLSAGGIRIEPHAPLELGESFKLALRGPGLVRALLVDARVIRDDGPRGFALAFDGVDSETENEIEKLVACLPDVETLADGETGSLGAIVSEVIRH